MKYNVDSLFFRDSVLPKETGTYYSGTLEGAGAVPQSQALDLRKHGVDHTRDLIIRVHMANAAAQTAGEATVRPQASSDGDNWTDVGSSVVLSKNGVDANNEIIIAFPRTGVKQFMRLKVVTTTAFTVDPVLFGGLDADAEYGIDMTLMDSGRQSL